ncbi:MAG: hypothetical protein ACTSW1_10230 [Candidatus Hodarchaeales archaeon]
MDTKHRDFFKKWFNYSVSFIGTSECSEHEIPPDKSLELLFGIKKENLKPYTVDLLNYSNEIEPFKELVRGIRAYLQFQDILDLSFKGEGEDTWNRHYCYYESLVYLRESVLSWLDQNILAALTLLRPFMELSIMHIYWYSIALTSNYKKFYLWLDNQANKPSFTSMLHNTFDHLPSKDYCDKKRVAMLKNTLKMIYKSLCAYNHTPKLDESITSMNRSTNAASLDSFYYYLHTTCILLKQLIYLYILAYPTSVFPVDRYRKWGTGGVMGLFFDKFNFKALEDFIGNQNIQKLKDELKNCQLVQDLQSFFDSFKDMTDEELDTDWKDFCSEYELNMKEITGHTQRIGLLKAHSRALRWMTNYFNRKNNNNDNIDDEIVAKMNDIIENW